jgi:hypothetical protein
MSDFRQDKLLSLPQCKKPYDINLSPSGWLVSSRNSAILVADYQFLFTTGFT